MLVDGLLPYLDRASIMAAYAAAPGREAESGKFLSRESSAALVANAFGYFGDRAGELALPAALADCGTPRSVRVEQSLRFPWRGGRHPWLDAVIETGDSLVAVESKRYEPFRPRGPVSLSDPMTATPGGTTWRGSSRCATGCAGGRSASSTSTPSSSSSTLSAW